MTSDRTHRMWWWQLGRLPVLSVSLHADILNPPPSGGKIKLVLTSKMTGSRWVIPQGAFTWPLYSESHTKWFTFTWNCCNGKHFVLNQFTVIFDRFVEESWPSQIPRRLMQGYMCVWPLTWLEREKVKKLSFQCLVRSLTYTVCFAQKEIKHNIFLRYLLHTSTYSIYHSAKSIFSIYFVATSRKTSVCATACEPGGLSWRDCRVQMSGSWWPTAYTTLEKGGRGYSPRQVSDVCSLYVCVCMRVCVCIFIQ